MAPLLEIENLVTQYGRNKAVDDVSVAIEEGEAVGIIGPNGAGKSTLLSTAVGLRRPASGSIRLQGRDISKSSPEQLVDEGMILIPEGRQIFGTLSVAENLRIGLSSKRARANQSGRVAEALELFPVLERFYARSANTLSGGEQQQLAIARAIVASPRLMLLDEPSLGLAPLMVRKVMEVLRVLQARGTTILLVEQNAPSTIEFCDRTHIMRKGRIVLTGTGSELQDQREIINHYLGGRT